jgi:hypothetical protein
MEIAEKLRVSIHRYFDNPGLAGGGGGEGRIGGSTA